jgi:hypothetical protein
VVPSYPAAFKLVEETNVVGSCTPPTKIKAPERNPDPVTAILNEPTGSGFGETEVSVGPSGSIDTYTEPAVFPSEAVAFMVTGF